MAKMNQSRPHHSRCQAPDVKLIESVYENVTVSSFYGYCPDFTEFLLLLLLLLLLLFLIMFLGPFFSYLVFNSTF